MESYIHKLLRENNNNLAVTIFQALREAGCDVSFNTDSGIVDVVTPDSRRWDFTIPKDVTDK